MSEILYCTKIEDVARTQKEVLMHLRRVVPLFTKFLQREETDATAARRYFRRLEPVTYVVALLSDLTEHDR